MIKLKRPRTFNKTQNSTLDLSLTHLLAIQMRVRVIQKLQGWRALFSDHPSATQGLLVGGLLRVYHHPPVTEAALLQHSVLLLRSDLWGGLFLFLRSSHTDTPGWSLSAAGVLCDVGFCPWGRPSSLASTFPGCPGWPLGRSWRSPGLEVSPSAFSGPCVVPPLYHFDPPLPLPIQNPRSYEGYLWNQPGGKK